MVVNEEVSNEEYHFHDVFFDGKLKNSITDHETSNLTELIKEPDINLDIKPIEVSFNNELLPIARQVDEFSYPLIKT